ncbi:tRNA pseudouridine32 synthase [Marchantia polymorpha subsp. ruderalis]|nr:hypothetical protein MARPO_0190s0007 [Marchantia polymorpha]PTQ27611.1 hypothetical protein MARPO_0190s0007 [Marchantia polymorpha]BBN12444.1 hypothetical protein Mp_5g20110 [Marchantia polymorpha subsp. ruderalis]BBN12445.1 hypothetical protein Mp_5g20110 [Marchantia polymorpha subsp. ruderalis]|eukprot:PTQ27610.1 hypothetical protein MARPO_0190s0007 [Marchantia polymorpha]
MDSAEQQGDESIVWENPDTPANVDDYVFVKGKRMVRPYFFEFICHVKKRWAGKTIVDLFSGEFRQRPREYYIQAVQRGRLRVGGMRVTPLYVVRDSDKISHFVHRHEPPVLAEPVTVLEKTADVITVIKPASVPVHPCGQYRKNTVVGILEAEHKTGQLFPIHRLDRLVSGLLILARNAKTADEFRQEIEGGRVHKQYVAKVKGVFPAHEVALHAAVTYDAREGISTCRVETTTEKDNKGKEACTKFQRLSTDGLHSIVRCEPVTGRTHQIRVHLQHLGHPIANDYLYLQVHPPKRTLEETTADTAARKARSVSNDLSKDNDSGVNITACRKIHITEDTHTPLYSEASSGHARKKTDRQLENQGVGGGTQSVVSCLTDLVSDCHSVEHTSTPDDLAESNCEEGKIKTTEIHPEAVMESDPPKSSSQPFVLDHLCTHCPSLGPSGYKQDDEGLWLHCVRYASASWSYECPLPSWAL